MDDTNNNQQPISDFSSYSTLTNNSFWSRIMSFITAWGTWRGYLSALLLAILIAFPLYFVIHQSILWYSSYALKQNGTQATLVQLVAITADNLLIVSRTESTAMAIVRLKNSNKGFGVATLRYSFKNDNSSIKEVSGTTYILPNEEKILAVPLQVGLTTGWRFDLQNPTDFSRPVLANKISLTSSSVRGQSTEAGYEITGQIFNNSPYHINKAEVNIILHYPSGQIRTALVTQATNFKAGTSQPFSVLWPQALPSDTVVEVRSSVDTFSRNNFSVSDIVSAGDQF